MYKQGVIDSEDFEAKRHYDEDYYEPDYYDEEPTYERYNGS
jgi:hypothetical protein